MSKWEYKESDGLTRTGSHPLGYPKLTAKEYKESLKSFRAFVGGDIDGDYAIYDGIWEKHNKKDFFVITKYMYLGDFDTEIEKDLKTARSKIDSYFKRKPIDKELVIVCTGVSCINDFFKKHPVDIVTFVTEGDRGYQGPTGKAPEKSTGPKPGNNFVALKKVNGMYDLPYADFMKCRQVITVEEKAGYLNHEYYVIVTARTYFINPKGVTVVIKNYKNRLYGGGSKEKMSFGDAWKQVLDKSMNQTYVENHKLKVYLQPIDGEKLTAETEPLNQKIDPAKKAVKKPKRLTEIKLEDGTKRNLFNSWQSFTCQIGGNSDGMEKFYPHIKEVKAIITPTMKKGDHTWHAILWRRVSETEGKMLVWEGIEPNYAALKELDNIHVFDDIFDSVTKSKRIESVKDTYGMYNHDGETREGLIIAISDYMANGADWWGVVTTDKGLNKPAPKKPATKQEPKKEPPKKAPKPKAVKEPKASPQEKKPKRQVLPRFTDGKYHFSISQFLESEKVIVTRNDSTGNLKITSTYISHQHPTKKLHWFTLTRRFYKIGGSGKPYREDRYKLSDDIAYKDLSNEMNLTFTSSVEVFSKNEKKKPMLKPHKARNTHPVEEKLRALLAKSDTITDATSDEMIGYKSDDYAGQWRIGGWLPPDNRYVLPYFMERMGKTGHSLSGYIHERKPSRWGGTHWERKYVGSVKYNPDDWYSRTPKSKAYEELGARRKARLSKVKTVRKLMAEGKGPKQGHVARLGIERQTGKENQTAAGKKADAPRKAMLPGYRVSASGRLYRETRANRSDTPKERMDAAWIQSQRKKLRGTGRTRIPDKYVPPKFPVLRKPVKLPSKYVKVNNDNDNYDVNILAGHWFDFEYEYQVLKAKDGTDKGKYFVWKRELPDYEMVEEEVTNSKHFPWTTVDDIPCGETLGEAIENFERKRDIPRIISASSDGKALLRMTQGLYDYIDKKNHGTGTKLSKSELIAAVEPYEKRIQGLKDHEETIAVSEYGDILYHTYGLKDTCRTPTYIVKIAALRTHNHPGTSRTDSTTCPFSIRVLGIMNSHGGDMDAYLGNKVITNNSILRVVSFGISYTLYVKGYTEKMHDKVVSEMFSRIATLRQTKEYKEADDNVQSALEAFVMREVYKQILPNYVYQEGKI